MIKKVIVTGANGQDSSTMIDYLLKETDHEIYGIVRREEAKFHPYLSDAIKNPRFHLVSGNVAEKTSVQKYVKEICPDFYLNFAGQSRVAESKNLPEETLATNVFGVIYAIESLKKNKRDFRFLNAGSSEQFSPAEYAPQNELHPFHFNNPYGLSKILAHQYIKESRTKDKIFAINPILYNHIGPRSGTQFLPKKIIKGVADCYFDDKFPLIVGNLNAKRDWSSSEDFIQILWKIINSDTPKDYVISSGKLTSVRDLITMAFSYGIANVEWEEDKLIHIRTGAVICQSSQEFFRPEEDLDLVGDSSLLYKDFKWNPKTNVEYIVRDMINNEFDNTRKRF